MKQNTPSISTFFFGNRGVFSATAFNHLIQEGVSISRVFCASPSPALSPERSLPVTQPIKEEGLDTLANRLGIPVQHINNRAELDTLNIQKLAKPDFILIACFPLRLPEFCIRWPKLGCLNIHPSLLPQYRGPDPIFWQLFNNESKTGVSLHFVTSLLDSGPVVSQSIFPFKEGASRANIESSSAKVGAELFTALLTKNITQRVTGKAQNESCASYHPNPSISDNEISLEWGARHAYNFIRGTRSPSGYYDIKTKKNHLKIISAIEYTNNGNILGEIEKSNGDLLIQFSPGILRVKPV